VNLLLFAALACAAPQVKVSTGPAGDDLLMGILKEEGTPLGGGEFTIKAPQAELRVVADGFPVLPAMGLTTWVSFSSGELVLLEPEVAPIKKAAEAAGFRVDGVESRYVREKPRVYFLSVSAQGPLEALQDAAQALLAAVSDGRRGKGLQAGPTKAASAPDQAALQAVLGFRPVIRERVVRFERADGSWAAFVGTDDRAAVCGMLRRVEGASGLYKAGIETAALSGGRLYFWGVGKAGDLARALKPFL
jgi:hypothetical protein